VNAIIYVTHNFPEIIGTSLNSLLILEDFDHFFLCFKVLYNILVWIDFNCFPLKPFHFTQNIYVCIKKER